MRASDLTQRNTAIFISRERRHEHQQRHNDQSDPFRGAPPPPPVIALVVRTNKLPHDNVGIQKYYFKNNKKQKKKKKTKNRFNCSLLFIIFNCLPFLQATLMYI